MSFNELLAELPTLTSAERQLLIQRALELDNGGLSPQEEDQTTRRAQEHRQDPKSSVPLEELYARLRSRFGQ